VSYVSRATHVFSENFETKEDAGTPGILQFIKASMAYELRNKIGLDYIAQKEQELKMCFKKGVQTVENMQLYCLESHHKLAIFSFNIIGIDPYELAQVLSDRYKIQVRAGCSCAGPYGHDLLGFKDNETFSQKPGWIRIGFHFTHSCDDIAYFFDSLKQSIKQLSVLKNS